MIERRTTNAPSPPYKGRVSIAFGYAYTLITTDPTVRSLVKGFETVGGPIELAACLGKPRMLPHLYFTLQAGNTAVASTGSEGTPRHVGPLEVAVAAVVAGTDPSHAILIWDAVADAIGRDYRTTRRLTEMWDYGVSAIAAGSYPTAIASGPETTERRSAALGVILVTL